MKKIIDIADFRGTTHHEIKKVSERMDIIGVTIGQMPWPKLGIEVKTYDIVSDELLPTYFHQLPFFDFLDKIVPI